MEDNELFGERHEQEENGLYGRKHAELCDLHNVSNCDHSNEVQRQGDGFVYTVCGDCGKDLG